MLVIVQGLEKGLLTDLAVLRLHSEPDPLWARLWTHLSSSSCNSSLSQKHDDYVKAGPQEAETKLVLNMQKLDVQ